MTFDPAGKEGIRVFSYGGGVQSNAVLLLQIEGQLDYDAFVFANVGDDSENPETLDYVQNIMQPYAAQHGIEIHEARKVLRDGRKESLYKYAQRTKRSIPIPARMGGNGAPGHRTCTTDFKIKVVDKWIKAQGVAWAAVGLGISWDESDRMRGMDWHDRHGKRKFGFWKRREYPLIDMRLRRSDLREIYDRHDLPIPPKSSCWFCPFHKHYEWLDMRRDAPALFNKAVEFEADLNQKRVALGRDRVFLHQKLVPLDQAVGLQLSLFDDDSQCDEGYCGV